MGALVAQADVYVCPTGTSLAKWMPAPINVDGAISRSQCVEDDGVTRLTLIFAAFLCSLPAASASLSPRNDAPPLGKSLLPTTAKDAKANLDGIASAPAPEPKQEKQDFVITDATEVKLDGHMCKFQDVPGTATVVSLDVASDKKTILKIHFASKK